jgi:hypothetical protein
MKYLFPNLKNATQDSLFTKGKHFLIGVICLLLLALWVVVVTKRYSDFDLFNANMQALPFTSWVNAVLALLVAGLEPVAALLLIWGQSRIFGVWLSCFLLVSYTCYIGMVLLGFFGSIPCTCASPISGLSWTQHFFFNLSASGLAGLGLYLESTSKQ